MIIQSSFRSNKKHGFTLTELAIVLSIMGLILGAIWAAASKVYFNQKVTKAVTQTLALAEGMKTAFPNGTIPASSTYGGFAVNSGMAPNDMIQSCTGLEWGTVFNGGATECLANPWGDQVIIGSQQSWTGTTPSSRKFEIVIAEASPGMTAIQCSAFLAAVVPAAVNDGLVSVGFSGTVVNVDSSTSPAVFSNCAANSQIALQFQL